MRNSSCRFISVGLGMLMVAWLSRSATPREPWLSVPYSGVLRSVAFGNGLFVAVGDYGLILSSKDGATWVTRQEATNAYHLAGVAFGDRQFVAVGGQFGHPSRPVILTSPTGTDWRPENSSSIERDGNFLFGIGWGNGTWVAIGSAIVSSSDGMNWVSRHALSRITPYIGSVSYGNGRFVVSNFDTVYVSTNILQWTEQQLPGAWRIRAVAHHGARFVAVGPYSRIYSTNGLTWFSGAPRTLDYWYGLAYGDGVWVGVGNSQTPYSFDGINWTGQSDGTFGRAVAYGNGLFVSLDIGTNIYRTMTSVQIVMQRVSPPSLSISGLVPGRVQIESKVGEMDQNGWSLLSVLEFTNSPALWTDGSATNAPTRFYRVGWNPSENISVGQPALR